MNLKAKIPTLDGLPEPYHALYTKGADGYDLTGVEGYTPLDREKTAKALRTERDSAKDANGKLKAWAIFGDQKPEDIQAELDKIEEYKLAAKGKLDESEIATRVEARLKTLKAPLERQLAEANEKAAKAEAQVQSYQKAEERAHIRAEIQKHAAQSNALPEAYAPGGGLLALLEGALEVEVVVEGETRKLGKVVTKDGAGYPSGLDVEKLLKQVQTTQGYFWAPSNGSGPRPTQGPRFPTGKNPWAKDSFNRTEQMRIHGENPEMAKRMMAEAGV